MSHWARGTPGTSGSCRCKVSNGCRSSLIGLGYLRMANELVELFEQQEMLIFLFSAQFLTLPATRAGTLHCTSRMQSRFSQVHCVTVVSASPVLLKTICADVSHCLFLMHQPRRALLLAQVTRCLQLGADVCSRARRLRCGRHCPRSQRCRRTRLSTALTSTPKWAVITCLMQAVAAPRLHINHCVLLMVLSSDSSC